METFRQRVTRLTQLAAKLSVPMVFLLSLAIFLIPLIHQWRSVQFEWHDVGHAYFKIKSLFTYGYFHSHDWNRDHFNIHFTPFFYVIAVLLRPFTSAFSYVFLCAAALAGSLALVFKNSLLVTTGRSNLVPNLILWFGLLLNPYLASLLLYPHWEVFGMFLLLAFATCVYYRRWLPAMLLFVAALLVKQDFWIYGIAAALSLTNRSNFKKTLIFVGVGLLYYLVVLRVIYPALYPQRFNQLAEIWAYGTTEWQVLQYLVTHPIETGMKVLSGHGLAFLASLGFFPFLVPLSALSGFAVLYLWVNATAIDRLSLAYFYSLPTFCLFLILIPQAWKRLNSWVKALQAVWIRKTGRNLPTRFHSFLFPTIVTLSALLAHWILPEGLRRSPHLARVFAAERSEREDFVFGLIKRYLAGNTDSVFTQFALASYVPYRKDLLVSHLDHKALLENKSSPTYILLDIKRGDYDSPGAGHINHRISQDERYSLLEHFDGIYLYHRRQS